MSLFAQLFSDLGMLTLEAQADGRFAALNAVPPWYLQISSVPVEAGNLPLLEVFPFVENFMQDAALFWDAGSKGRLASGIWTELDEQGNQHQLEAYALRYEDIRLLILQDLTQTFDARHHVYQRAREIALTQERVVASLQRQQRKLQVKLHSLLAQDAPLASISERIKDHASAVMVCKPDGSVELLNQALVDIYPTNSDAFSHQSVLNQWVQEAAQSYPEIHRVVGTGSYWEGEFETTIASGGKKWVRLIIGPVKDAVDNVTHLVCIANDITGIREPSIELEKVADFDFTTQLPNRRQFWRVLAKNIEECRNTGEKVLLLYLDLDRFKQINDSFDHHAGDLLLAAVSSRLQRSIKKADFIAHLGGDEFAIVMRSSKRHLDINSIAERLLKIINQPVLIADNAIHITASLGIAGFPEQAGDAVAMMKYADLAMYHAKQAGRNRYQIYNRALNEAYLNRVLIQRDMASALANGEMYLVYQPQVLIGHNAELRLEALLRWHHPQRGLISPAVFIPLAEESDFINQLGHWVLERACYQALEFSRKLMPVVVAVNVSPRQLRAEDFYDQVQQVLQLTGLPAAQLELEITETVLLDNLSSHVDVLRKLQALGITIALDDFGSGFSSLNYLKNLPVDRLKIDQSFIREIPRDEESKTITASLVNLAHELHMKVVAEGVEHPDQLRFLKAIGCDYVQGFLLFTPSPPEEMGEIVERLAVMAF